MVCQWECSLMEPSEVPGAYSSDTLHMDYNTSERLVSY